MLLQRTVEIRHGFPLAKGWSFSDQRTMQIKMLGRGMMWLTVAAFLVSAGAARAVGPEVRDSAGLFSPAAVQQADAAIQKLQKELGKELLIETFAGVPENRKADYSRSREEFFTSFVRERAQAARLNGIYVMVMKEEPPHRMRIQIGLGEATRQRAFLASDRDQLVRVLQASFRDNKYDEGLTSAVAFVERTVRSHLSSTTAGSVAPSGVTRNAPSSAPDASAEHSAAAPSSGPNLLKWAFIIGGVLVAVFLVRMLSGAMGGGGGGGLSGGGMGGMGGGGMGGMMRIDTDSPRKMTVATICLNHGKADPNPRMKYKVVRLAEVNDSPVIEEFCKALATGKVSQNTAQAAAWHVANGLTWDELTHKPRVISEYTGVEMFFTAFEVQAAMRLTATATQEAERLASYNSSNKVSTQSKGENESIGDSLAK